MFVFNLRNLDAMIVYLTDGDLKLYKVCMAVDILYEGSFQGKKEF